MPYVTRYVRFSQMRSSWNLLEDSIEYWSGFFSWVVLDWGSASYFELLVGDLYCQRRRFLDVSKVVN